MAEVNYPECIRELYDSEIYGEAASQAIYNVATKDRHKYHMSVLMQLETETKARLRPFLYKYGISLSEDIDLEAAKGAAGLYQNASWQEFAATVGEDVKNFLSRFEEIAAAGPEVDQEILQSMVRHEKAILKWAEMESQGENDRSLDAMVAELKYPLK